MASTADCLSTAALRPPEATLAGRPTVAFAFVFMGVAAMALYLAWQARLREAASIALFIPLIWAYLTLSLRWMIVSVILTAVLRVAVESLQIANRHGVIDPLTVASESVFPILLYVFMGVPLYVYRVRQSRLTRRLIDNRAQEIRAQVVRCVAHDFANVLAVVMGTGQLLAKNATLDSQGAKDVQTILNAATQGAGLVGQMRDFSRSLQSGKEMRDLSEATEAHMLLIERILPLNIRTMRAYAQQPLPVSIDMGEYLRLVMNLCLNARDAMPEGGTLTIQTRQDEVQGQRRAILTIADTGTGIAAANLQSIFEPFFTTRADQGGAGLGLSIVKMVVESHAGHIEVQSMPGQGTTFTISFPIHESSGA